MRLLLITFMLGCGGAPPVATVADAQRVHLELAELQQGRSLLVGKCSGCHRPPLPTDHSIAEWPGKLGEMSERAGLLGPQRHMIEEYLVTMAQR